MALVLDAGALIAIDRQDRTVGAVLRVAQKEGIPVRTSATVVAQVWRGGKHQANLSRVLTGIDINLLDGSSARKVGEVLADTKTSDIVDGHLGLIISANDTVLTSDTDDIRKVLRARSVRATVRRV
jgi:alkylated DNA nucleotide flippase Atl1